MRSGQTCKSFLFLYSSFLERHHVCRDACYLVGTVRGGGRALPCSPLCPDVVNDPTPPKFWVRTDGELEADGAGIGMNFCRRHRSTFLPSLPSPRKAPMEKVIHQTGECSWGRHYSPRHLPFKLTLDPSISSRKDKEGVTAPF